MTTHIEPGAPAPPAVVSKKSSRVGWIVVLLVLIIAAVGVAFWWTREHGKSLHAAPTRSHEAEAAPTTAEPSEAVRVDVVHPQPGGITRTSTQTGSVHAYEDADLYAKVSGYLKTLNVDIGDKVKEGQELAAIDDPELVEEEQHAEAALKQAKAAVQVAEAKLESSKASEASAAAKIKVAQADVEHFTSTRRYREKELARYRDLYNRGAVQRAIVEEEEEHLESARGAEKSARAAVLEADARHEEAKAMVSQADADLMFAKAEAEVAQSNLDKAKVLVGYMTIKSPYTGVVTARNVHPGAFIRSAAEGSEKPLLNVARTDLMRIVTYVPDRDVPYVDVGDKAEVKLDALNETIVGKVTRFSDSEVAESRTMRTEIHVPNPTGRIREGMFGQATIILEQTNAALSVPASCLAGESKGGKAAVFVVRDGKAKQVPIMTGADDGIKVEVVSGLSHDDQVITTRGGVTDGTPVVVAQDQTQAAPVASNAPSGTD